MNQEEFDFIELVFEFPQHLGGDYPLFPIQIARQMGMKPVIYSCQTILNTRRKDVINNIEVHRFKSVFSMIRQLIKARPKLTHGHSFGWLPATIAPLLVSKYVFTPHIYKLDIYPPWKVNIVLNIIKKSAAIITLTPFEKSQFKHITNESKIHVIPHPIDYDFFSQLGKNEKRKIFDRYHLDPQNELILCIANLFPRKNLETLLRGFALIHKEIPSSKLVIVGGEPKVSLGITSPIRLRRNYRFKLDRLTTHLGVEKDVIFSGYQTKKEIRQFFAISRVFCLPSKVEGQLIAAGEAASAKLPLVLSNIKPLVEIYQGCALFHEPMDYKALAAHVINILKNPRLAKKLGDVGQSKMRAYDFGLIGTKLRELYENVLGN